jgi:hypothetical protein
MNNEITTCGHNLSTRNANTFGHIEGLLEGWNIGWDEMEKLTYDQAYRLRELFRLLDPAWIVNTMNCGMPSDKKLLTKLSEL